MIERTALVVTLVMVLAPVAVWAQAPAHLPVQGFLTDNDGVPVDGDTTMTFSLYVRDMDDTPVYSEEQVVLVEDGFFTVFVGQVEALNLALFRDSAPMYLGMAVGDEAEMGPRLALGSVPYAGFAQHAGDAQTLGGMSAEDFRATGDTVAWADLTDVPIGLDDGDADALGGLSCTAGQVAKWDVAGSAWACADDANDGTGVDTLAGLSCSDGQLAKWDAAGSAWGCADDVDTGFTTEAQLTALLDDNYLPASYLPAWGDLTGIPADIADGDANTTYTATAPITLVGSAFGLSPNGVTASHIAADAVTASHIADDAVTSPHIFAAAVTASHIATDSINSAKIINGSITASDLQDGAAIGEIADDDGSGSGLDADSLDGLDSSVFARTNAGWVFWNGNINDTGDMVNGVYCDLERFSSGNTIQFHCEHASGCDYTIYINGTRSAGILANGGTANIMLSSNNDDYEGWCLPSANGMGILHCKGHRTNGSWWHNMCVAQ